MSGGVFFDTNVVLYLLSADRSKADRAELLLTQGGQISVQVLNETAAVCRRKLGMPWPEIEELLTAIKAACTVHPLTIATHELALTIASRNQLSVYDALICSAAAQSGAAVLFSEDLSDGQVIEGVRITNPFR